MQNDNAAKALLNQKQYLLNEVAGLHKIVSYLWDGNQEAFNILYFLKANYKEWGAMFKWLVRNKKKGKDLVELFQNESPDGGGYHMGATYILSRIKGHRHDIVTIKIDELH